MVIMRGSEMVYHPRFARSVSLYKATNHSKLKGWVSMLPWHAIPFLKGLSMLTPQSMGKWVTPLMVVMQLAKEHSN